MNTIQKTKPGNDYLLTFVIFLKKFKMGQLVWSKCDLSSNKFHTEVAGNDVEISLQSDGVQIAITSETGEVLPPCGDLVHDALFEREFLNPYMIWKAAKQVNFC